MSQVGKIKSDGMAIKGNANMRTPFTNSPGEIHFSFDGVTHCRRSIDTLKVAGYRGERTSHPWFDHAQVNAYSFTEVLDLETVVAADFDLLVVDQWVWNVPSVFMVTLKALVDAGLSVVAIGNDSRNNVFVEGYDSTLRQAHTVSFDRYNVPEWFDRTSFSGSGDVFGGITELGPGCEPWYYRDDNGLITGYMYTSTSSGAKLFFDQEAFFTENPQFPNAIMEYVAGFTTANKLANNLNLSNRGLVVERGVTNLESDKADTLGNDGRPFNSVSHTQGGLEALQSVTGEYGVPEPPFPDAEVWKVAGASPDGYQRVSLVGRHAENDWSGYDKDYIASIWVYIPESVVFRNSAVTVSVATQNDTGVDWHSGNHAPNATYGFYSKNITIDSTAVDQDIRGEWQQVWIRFRPDSTAINLSGNNDVDKIVMYWRICTDDDAVWSGTNFVYVSALQVEQRDYVTSWSPDVRPGNQRYELPVKPASDFSLAFEIIPHEHLYRDANGPRNAELFTLVDETTSRQVGYWDYSNAAGISHPFFNLETDADWDSVQHHWHHNVYYTRHESHYVLLTKTGSTMRAVWYDKEFNVLTDSSFTYTDSDKMDTFTLSRIIVGQEITGNVWGCTIPKLSYYDRVISDDVMNAWMKPQFKVTSEGDLYCAELDEQIYVPDDSYYFPLDYDAMDISKTIDAVKKDNLHFAEGGVWISKQSSNLYTGEHTIGTPLHDEVIEDGWFKVTRVDDTVAAYGKRFKVSLGSLTNGLAYTAAYTVHNPSDLPVDIYLDWCDQNLTYITILPNETRSVYVTGSLPTYDETYRFADVGVAVAGQSIWIKDVRIHRNNYMLPPNNQTSGYSWLAYNLHQDVGVDWGAEWSIVYFVKPIGTYVEDKGGYNLCALGGYNAGSASYIFFGKQLDANEIYLSNPSSFDPDGYFDQWHCVSLVHDGAGIITINHYDIDGVDTRTRLRTTALGVPDTYVTSDGVDLQMGSWSVGDEASNSIYKDLVVANRAFTQEEIDKIRKSWVSINSKTRISGSFLEGII